MGILSHMTTTSVISLRQLQGLQGLCTRNLNSNWPIMAGLAGMVVETDLSPLMSTSIPYILAALGLGTAVGNG